MKWKSLIIALIFSFHGTAFALTEENLISTIPVENTDYYPFVYYLTCGEVIYLDSLESKNIHGFFYRVAIANYEIYKTIYIEKVLFGHEGCCMKVQSIREINEDDFAEKFGYVQHMIIYFDFISWLSPTSFMFKARGDFFIASEIDKPEIIVLKIE